MLAGDAAVGKSCFIHRFCRGKFEKRLGSTLGKCRPIHVQILTPTIGTYLSTISLLSSFLFLSSITLQVQYSFPVSGVDFQIKTIRVDEKNVALQLWDTAGTHCGIWIASNFFVRKNHAQIKFLFIVLGQERFRSMTKTYFRRADGVVLLYDVTSERSFLSIRQWIQSINVSRRIRLPAHQ